jgi:acetyl esterase/lipase
MTTIHHPEHLLDRAAMVAMRLMLRSAKGSVNGPDARKGFDELLDKVPAAPWVTHEAATVGGVSGWWCRPADAGKDAAILYLHGGGYVVGTARAYLHLVGQIATRTIEVHTWQGMIHVFPSNVALLKAAKEALDDVGEFLRWQLLGEPAAVAA